MSSKPTPSTPVDARRTLRLTQTAALGACAILSAGCLGIQTKRVSLEYRADALLAEAPSPSLSPAKTDRSLAGVRVDIDAP